MTCPTYGRHNPDLFMFKFGGGKPKMTDEDGEPLDIEFDEEDEEVEEDDWEDEDEDDWEDEDEDDEFEEEDDEEWEDDDEEEDDE